MKLEEGKTYVRRDGELVTVTLDGRHWRPELMGPDPYPNHVWRDTNGIRTYNDHGWYTDNPGSQLDLISEWAPTDQVLVERKPERADWYGATEESA